MTEEQTQWVEGQRLWIASQKNLVEQVRLSIQYSEAEIDLHQQAIKTNTDLLHHYQNGITATEGHLNQYIKDNQE